MLDWIKRGVFGRDLSKVRLLAPESPDARRSELDAPMYNAFVSSFLRM